MSEFQYYEFKAIDRPLSAREIAAIRKITTRAELTPTSFVNTYEWGDFKGNPRKLMEKYYDAFVYIANWGTHWLMLRLPRKQVDLKAARAYQAKDALTIHETSSSVIFEFHSEEDPEHDVDDGSGWMGSLVLLREGLAKGDFRSLYLAWLSAAQNGHLKKDAKEPPVPTGLGSLPGPLKALAEFMRVRESLIRTAAVGSATESPQRANKDALKRWIRFLPGSKRDSLLLKLAVGDDPHLRAELLKQSEQPRRPAPKSTTSPQRTIGELLTAEGKHSPPPRSGAMPFYHGSGPP